MPETVIIVLLILWLMGLISGVTVGGFLHILLIVAILLIILRVLQV